MTIAVTYSDGEIFQHFGHTAQFKLYEAEEGRILSSRIIDTGSSGHSALAALLAEQGVDVLICGGIGGCARTALAQAGIRHFGGVRGDADAAAESFAAGTLEYDPCAQCSHHREAHSCGSHSCH